MNDDAPTGGMLRAPMKRCAECDHWSYYAAMFDDGRCLSCSGDLVSQEDDRA